MRPGQPDPKEKEKKDVSEREKKRRHTKDLRYESNDSREMEKGSISPTPLWRVSVEVRRDDRKPLGHSPFSSVGDGCTRKHVSTSVPSLVVVGGGHSTYR